MAGECMERLKVLNRVAELRAGEAEKIIARAPLRLADGQLFIDLALIGNFADDAAAAAGSVPVGGIYRTGSVLKIRVA